MSIEFRHWLPVDALTDKTVRADLAETVKAWSERWSCGAPALIRDLRAWAGNKISPDGTQLIGQPVKLEWSARQAMRLACWALDIADAETVMTQDDRSVLEAMGEDIGIDLTAALARGLAIGSHEAPQAGPAARIALEVELPDRRGDAAMRLRVLIPASDLASFRKSRCAPYRPARALPRAFPLAVLPDAEVELGALLGKSELSLRDLRSIEVGDVIRLDTRLEAPIAIGWQGGAGAVLGCTFQPGEAGAVLTLCSADAVIQG